MSARGVGAIVLFAACAAQNAQVTEASLPPGVPLCRDFEVRSLGMSWQACALGRPACHALRAALQKCGPFEAVGVQLLVSTDASGRITDRCVSVSERELSPRSLACVSSALDAAGTTSALSVIRSPLHIRAGPAFVYLEEDIGVSREQILGVIKGAIPDIQRCVRDQRVAQQGLTGKAVFKWRVLGDGSVTDVSLVSTELEGTVIAKCLGTLIAGLKFPANDPPGEDPIVFPFKF